MTRVCELTGVRTRSGNNVSHSVRRTKRKFVPNLHSLRLYSEALASKFRLRISAAALRTVEKFGGLDKYITSCSNDNLSKNAKALKFRVLNKLERKSQS